jgi:alpha-glucosidase
MYQATLTGMPIARALFLNDPEDPQVYNHLDDQFFVDHDILVAPFVAQYETASPPMQPIRSVYLPSGSNWYAFTDNLRPLAGLVPGGNAYNWYGPLTSQLPLDIMPIYIRAGAILPMRELEQYVGQLNPNPITFNIYPGPDSTFTLYLDDGISNNYLQGQYRLVSISHQTVGAAQQVRVLRTTDQFAPPETYYFVAFLGSTTPPNSVQAAGVNVPNVFTPDALATANANSYYYNQSIQTTFLKIIDSQPDITVEVS